MHHDEQAASYLRSAHADFGPLVGLLLRAFGAQGTGIDWSTTFAQLECFGDGDD